MDRQISEIVKETLVWFPEKEIGYSLPVKPIAYDDKYFNQYIEKEDTEVGRKLNDFRVELVNRYTNGRILDVGIGNGAFIKNRGNCWGYDVNPKGIEWLKTRSRFLNPYEVNMDYEGVAGITFFDSLEHIMHPSKLLKRISKQLVFISIPIFNSLSHLLVSKHFKKNEHIYYFTTNSFVNYMSLLGFKWLEFSNQEITCGREDIYTFVFRK